MHRPVIALTLGGPSNRSQFKQYRFMQTKLYVLQEDVI